MSLNQILKWALENLLPMLVTFLLSLIDTYFPAGTAKNMESKLKLRSFLKTLQDCPEANHVKIQHQILKAR